MSRPVPSRRALVALFALPVLSAALLALLALLVGPRAAHAAGHTQARCPVRRGTHVSRHDDGGRRTLLMADAQRCLEVHSVGDVALTDDDADVARLAPGATLSVEETRGGVVRRVEFAERDGRVQRRYLEDGRPRDEADGAAWVRAILPQVARESTIGADARVARILRQRGPRGVLEEVRVIGSDGVKRTYLTALLAEPRLGDDALREVVRTTATALSSDGDRRRLLVAVAERPNVAGPTLAAVVDAARAISSDSDRGRVLAAALAASGDALLADDAGRTALFGAVGGIGSDREKGAVLRLVLRRERLAGPALLGALRAAAGISSDREKAEVLLVAAGRRDALLDDGARRAFLDVTRGISSSGEYRRVMDAVVR